MSALAKLKSFYWSAMAQPEVLKLRRKMQIRAMLATEDPMVRLLGEAITDVADQRFSDVERDYFSRIEDLRARLAAADEQVVTRDFGAGEPTDHLTKQEMEAGRVKTIAMSLLCGHTSLRYPWTQLIFAIARRLAPAVSLELGTCVGMSGSYIAAAHEVAGIGRLVTLEGSETFANIARDNFARLRLNRVDVVVGRFQDTLDTTLARCPGVKFAHVDGHHDGDATLNYFDTIANAAPPGTIILFDDIKWYDSMRRAWQAITADERTRTVVDLDRMGLIVTGPTAVAKNEFALNIS